MVLEEGQEQKFRRSDLGEKKEKYEQVCLWDKGMGCRK